MIESIQCVSVTKGSDELDAWLRLLLFRSLQQSQTLESSGLLKSVSLLIVPQLCNWIENEWVTLWIAINFLGRRCWEWFLVRYWIRLAVQIARAALEHCRIIEILFANWLVFIDRINLVVLCQAYRSRIRIIHIKFFNFTVDIWVALSTEVILNLNARPFQLAQL